jgi:hypothetical protein
MMENISPSWLFSFEILKKVIVNECGGLIGALRISVDYLADKLKLVNPITESVAIQEYFSKDLLVPMARCFGSELMLNWSPSVRQSLMAALGGSIIANPNDQQVQYLVKCGVLLSTICGYKFSSPLAKRYFSAFFYPDRALRNPPNLNALIEDVITSMSSNTLQLSVSDSNHFPKHAVFQHLFMQGLTQNTISTCSICPELSYVFPADGDFTTEQLRIDGEIDFYINSTLRWGIELLINGNGIGEHISRFDPLNNGKYVPLQVSDYVVVDIRVNPTGSPTSVLRHEKRVTVFFATGDFSSCNILIGATDEIKTVRLQH